MKAPAFVTLSALLVLGCAVVQTLPEPAKESNPRVVYRDLTKPKQISYLVPKDVPYEPVSAVRKEAIVFFIEFENDSFKNFDEVQLKPLVAGTASTANVLVVGHSHGQSAIGTLPLASKRAETIRGYLQGRGFVNVHTMAFWGAQAVSFAPTRGVQVYVLPEGADQGKTLPVVFAKQAREVHHENLQGDSVVSCGTVATDPVKAGLDNV
ncbi:MAG: hypothetical protein M0036_09370 [Desulfobacteraceae bacterium]|nr:hypothetical protein [Desulfobacteraceae bacterium]